MSWFNPKNPQTGTGQAKPKSRSLPAVVNLVFRSANGKKIQTPKKGKK